MAQPTNAVPRFEFNGINDQSRRPNVREEETYPQHFPLVHIFAQDGPTFAVPIVGESGGAFATVFGDQTLKRRSKYFNTQSLLVETMLGEGNGVFVKRIVPDNAPPPARITLAIDIVQDRIPSPTKSLSGFDYPDNVAGDDAVVPADAADDPGVLGYRARLVLIDDNTANVGKQKIMDGGIVSEDGEQSQVIPLMEVPSSWVGDRGNLKGFRLWAVTNDESPGYDAATATTFETRMYRAQFLTRPTVGSTPVITKTILGDQYVDVCFTPGAYSESTDLEYYIGDVLTQAFEDDGIDSGTTPIYSPFSQCYVYQENLEMVQKMIFDAEITANPSAETSILAPGMIDVFGGVDIEGDAYHALLLEGPAKGGILLSQSNAVYAQGGGDGDMTHQTYENGVVREVVNFGELEDEYANLAVYPFSVLYDTGLSMEGKFAMMGILGKRQDVQLRFTTFVEAEERMPTRPEEISREQALMARLRAMPESTLYSTPVCRAEIILQTGEWSGGGYSKLVPQIIDYAQCWARQSGAGTGNMRPGLDIDVEPNNTVRLIKKINVPYWNDRAASQIWENGGTYSLSYDRRSSYYPSLHSVYNDDTSVLISPITVSICCDVIRLIRRVHAMLSGNAKWTKEQFIEKADNKILEMVSGRYNDRVKIRPKTYFTAADDLRGYTWHCKVSIFANNPRNTMIFDLETRRMEDLANEVQ